MNRSHAPQGAPTTPRLSQADEFLRRALALPADTAARLLPAATGPRRRAMQVRGV